MNLDEHSPNAKSDALCLRHTSFGADSASAAASRSLFSNREISILTPTVEICRRHQDVIRLALGSEVDEASENVLDYLIIWSIDYLGRFLAMSLQRLDTGTCSRS